MRVNGWAMIENIIVVNASVIAWINANLRSIQTQAGTKSLA